MEFSKIKISDIGRIVTGKTPKTSIPENYGGNIPFLTPSDNLSNKYVPKTTKTITELGLSEVKNCLLPANSICVSCIGSDLGKVVLTTTPLVTNQQFNSIIPSNDFDSDFIYYLMTIIGKQINFLSKTSTAVPIINKSTFSNLDVFVPSLNDQIHIAKILSSLDDKIELNRQINDNLEQQAQALFKSWFVDFEPFKDGEFVDSELGMIPKGWRVGNIGDYCKIRSGYAFKSSWWTDNGVKIIKIRNITESGTLDMSDCSHVLSHNCEKAVDFKALTGDLIIAMTGATIGKFCIIPKHSEEYYINQRVGKFFLGNKPLEKLPFIHCLLKMESISADIINKGQGSAQPNISGSDIESTRIIFPPENIIDSFNRLLKPYYEKLIHNTSNNSSIENLRDTLLPRLMSGELKINEINC